MDNNNIIELINVSFKYAEGNAGVNGINLAIKKGEFVTLLGPSGCGKTTTLRMIGGFLNPQGGKILFNGKDITALPPYDRPFNTVFQRYALFPHLDVYDNVAFGLKLKMVDDEKHPGKKRHLTNKEIDEKVLKALTIVDLDELEDRDITTLSGGQQQRVAVARAIVMEPEILLLDEPLAALDLKMRKDMQLELIEMHKKLGITFVYVTHDQEEALTMSDTIVVMKDGEIQQVGRPNDIYDEPQNAFVADFVGQSNIYNGTIIDDNHVKFLNHTFECVDKFEKNEKVDVVVRPEDVKFCKAGEGMVDVNVISKIFKGDNYQYVGLCGKAEVVITTRTDYGCNKTLGVTIAPDLIHIMKKEYTTNVFDAYINNKNQVVIAGEAFDCDVCKLYNNSHLDNEGYLILEDGRKIDLNDVDVIAKVGFNDITLTDNEEDGTVYGIVISSIYKGDHYQILVRSENEEEDFVLDTEYAYNEGERVGIIIESSKIELTLKVNKDVK